MNSSDWFNSQLSLRLSSEACYHIMYGKECQVCRWREQKLWQRKAAKALEYRVCCSNPACEASTEWHRYSATAVKCWHAMQALAAR